MLSWHSKLCFNLIYYNCLRWLYFQAGIYSTANMIKEYKFAIS